jgi:hypothetical protein
MSSARRPNGSRDAAALLARNACKRFVQQFVQQFVQFVQERLPTMPRCES